MFSPSAIDQVILKGEANSLNLDFKQIDAIFDKKNSKHIAIKITIKTSVSDWIQNEIANTTKWPGVWLHDIKNRLVYVGFMTGYQILSVQCMINNDRIKEHETAKNYYLRFINYDEQ